MKKHIYRLLWLLLITLSPVLTASATNLTFDPWFAFWTLNWDAYKWIFSSAVQADGKIVIGGNFTGYNWVNQKYITRLNTDGTRDTSFTIWWGFNKSVQTIAIQADGKILVWWDFTNYSGRAQARLTRLNTNGTRDTSFNIGAGFAGNIGSVTTILIQPDGKILVWGYFTTFSGTSANRIVRLNADGTRDSSFNIGIWFNGAVRGMALQSDGKILVWWEFTTYSGTNQLRLTRLNVDGTRDTSFVVGAWPVSAQFPYRYTEAIVVQPDGKIVVWGWDSVNAPVLRVTRMNPDWSRDTSFQVDAYNNSSVYAMELQADGKILVGGYFNKGGVLSSLLRLNTDGTTDMTFTYPLTLNTPIYDIDLFGSKVVLSWRAPIFTTVLQE